jgi:hypothetical protein
MFHPSCRALRPLSAALLVAATTSTASQPPGATVKSLLAHAREANPEFALMQREAEAAAARAGPAGNLPDPVLALEWRDITRDGEGSPTLLPARVGSMKYTVRQMFHWPGKRELTRAAEASATQSTGAVPATWNELAMKLNVAHARRYELALRTEIVGEIDALLGPLEAISHARYAGRLAAQADAVRVLSERTMLRGEVITPTAQRRTADAQVNALLAWAPDAPLAAPLALCEPAAEPQFAALAISPIQMPNRLADWGRCSRSPSRCSTAHGGRRSARSRRWSPPPAAARSDAGAGHRRTGHGAGALVRRARDGAHYRDEPAAVGAGEPASGDGGVLDRQGR